jgi:hypothetical protein
LVLIEAQGLSAIGNMTLSRLAKVAMLLTVTVMVERARIGFALHEGFQNLAHSTEPVNRARIDGKEQGITISLALDLDSHTVTSM